MVKSTNNDLQNTTDKLKIYNTNPTNNRGWTQVLRKVYQFLIHLWHPKEFIKNSYQNQLNNKLSSTKNGNVHFCTLSSVVWKRVPQINIYLSVSRIFVFVVNIQKMSTGNKAIARKPFSLQTDTNAIP